MLHARFDSQVLGQNYVRVLLCLCVRECVCVHVCLCLCYLHVWRPSPARMAVTWRLLTRDASFDLFLFCADRATLRRFVDLQGLLKAGCKPGKQL